MHLSNNNKEEFNLVSGINSFCASIIHLSKSYLVGGLEFSYISIALHLAKWFIYIVNQAVQISYLVSQKKVKVSRDTYIFLERKEYKGRKLGSCQTSN